MKKRSGPKIAVEQDNKSLYRLGREHRFDSLLFCDEECDLDFRDISFYECTFRNVIFTGEIRQCMFTDVIFDHCDFSNCNMEESVMRRVQMTHCRMTGVDLIRSTLEDVEISGSHCGYANFNGSKFRRFLFRDNRMTETGFSMCTIEQPEIERCDFTGAEFLETRLADMDFTTSMIEGITVDPSCLKGVILNEEQAIACARILGIIVK